MKPKKIKTIIMLLFSLIAITILVDYFIDGQIVNESVISKNRSFENYNNAAGNSHYSYKIETKKFNFNISDEYANLVRIGDTIIITESAIFKEINASKIIRENYHETYSLRRVTALFIPLLLLIVIVISFNYFDKIKILAFVTVLVTIIDLIYLIL